MVISMLLYSLVIFGFRFISFLQRSCILSILMKDYNRLRYIAKFVLGYLKFPTEYFGKTKIYKVNSFDKFFTNCRKH